jgi:hypothetical protein
MGPLAMGPGDLVDAADGDIERVCWKGLSAWLLRQSLGSRDGGKSSWVSPAYTTSGPCSCACSRQGKTMRAAKTRGFPCAAARQVLAQKLLAALRAAQGSNAAEVSQHTTSLRSFEGSDAVMLLKQFRTSPSSNLSAAAQQ